MTDHDVPLTENQFKFLARFGVENPELLSRPEASEMVAELIDRAHAGLATLRQVKAAVGFGMDRDQARSMTLLEMKSYLDGRFSESNETRGS